MADIIDALFFELGITGNVVKDGEEILDTIDKIDKKADKARKGKEAEEKQEEKRSSNTRKRNKTALAEEDKKTKAITEGHKKTEKAISNNTKLLTVNTKANKELYSAINNVVSTIAKMATIVTAGMGLDNLVRDYAKANFQLDNTSKNLGLSYDSLFRWRGAAESAGGSAEGLTGFLSNLSGGLTRLTVMGDQSILPFFNAFGISALDASGKARNLDDVMLDLADRLSGMDRVTSYNLAKQMGMDDDTFNLLIRGRKEVDNFLKAQDKLYRAKSKDIEQSKQLYETTKRLQQQFESIKNILANSLSPSLVEFLKKAENLFKYLAENEDTAKSVFVGIATAIGTVFLPAILRATAAAVAFMLPFIPAALVVLGLGAAVGLLYDDYKKWSDGAASMFNWETFIKWFDEANFSVEGLITGFANLLTGYNNLDDVMKDTKDWLEKKGFTKDGEWTLQSIGNGFVSIGKDIKQWFVSVLGDVGRIIDELSKGNFTNAIKIAYEVIWDKTPVGVAPKALYKNITDPENVTKSLNLIGGNTVASDALENNKIFANEEFGKQLNSVTRDMGETERNMFLATVDHESGGLKRLDENLNYSFKTLKKLRDDGKVRNLAKYSDAQLEAMAGNPEAVGNAMYGGRMGNSADEGYKYRGRGPIQITGKNNYREIGKMIGVDLLNNPDLLSTNPTVAAMASAAWWTRERMQNASFNKAVNSGDFEAVSKGVNGGTIGMEDRKRLYAQYQAGNGALLGIGMINNNLVDPAMGAVKMAQSVANPAINNNKTDIVVNGGITVQTASNTLSGTGGDIVNGMADRVALLQNYNTGYN